MELFSVNHKQKIYRNNSNNSNDDDVFHDDKAKISSEIASNTNAKRSLLQRELSEKPYYSHSPTSIRNKQLKAFKEEEVGEVEKVLRKDVTVAPKKDYSYSKTDDRIKPSCNNTTTLSSSPTNFVAEFDDEISTGLPSDLPSDLFDIEGNLLYGNIHQLRFDLEDEDFSSADDEDHHHRQRHPLYSGKREKKRSQKKGISILKDKISSASSPSRSTSSPQKILKTFPNRKLQQSQNYGSSSSSTAAAAKFSPILTTCDSPLPSKGNVSFSEKIAESGVGTGGINVHHKNSGSSGSNFGTKTDSSSNERARTRSLRSRTSAATKQNSLEDSFFPFHSMLINNSIKGSVGGGAHYQLIGKRTLSSNPSSSSASNSGITNNNTSNSSGSGGGNFSPPSDQFRSPLAPFDRHHSSGGGSSSNNGSSTITQHYYPEGGWGYMILVTCTICHVLTCGFQLSFCILWNAIQEKFGTELQLVSCWLGAVSLGISLLLSPVWVSICKKKSTRLSAVGGGLISALGCLFTSFASQFHQTFISYGAFLGVGVGLTRDASSLMVGQYFKRKREMVEIIVVSGSGLGIIFMSILVHTAIGSLGWRLGLQAVTVSLILTFFLGTCYRSASLYHPQRRAILHLKNQKRKVKEKGKREDKPPFIDCGCLRSKTLRIILMSSSCTAFGIFTPLLSLAVQCSKKGFEDCSVLLLHIYIGISWIVGCCTIGLVVIQKSQDCRVSKQYLCQVASVICGISILALTAVKGTNGMVVFSWVYGASLGGYCYSLKVYTYERARARHFPRAWSFLQSAQAVPLFFGVPLTNYANEMIGWKAGYYLSAIAVFLGTACLFLTDVRRRKLSRRKSQNSSVKTCETTDGGTSSPKSNRLSFAFPVDQQLPRQQQSRHDSDEDEEPGGPIDPSMMMPELTDISEEGLADLDFQDIYFDELAEYIGGITSCNKVENCLVSEYDPELAIAVERRARRWSKQQHHPLQIQCNPVSNSVAGGGGNLAGAAATASTSTSSVPTGRLTLPGIGTVFEVPLLVAKRLHPNLGMGMRSRPRHHHHPHCNAVDEDEIDGDDDYLDSSTLSYHHPHDGGNSAGGECNFSRGGNCGAAAGTTNLNSTSPTTTTRVYHHPHHHGKTRGSNIVVSHFPAIDEDSV